MRSKRSLEGYLLLDNRAAGGRLVEQATLTCSHCHAIVVLNPERSRARNWCSGCDKYVCDNPMCHAKCVPLNKVLDSLQESALKGVQ